MREKRALNDFSITGTDKGQCDQDKTITRRLMDNICWRSSTSSLI